MRTKVFGWVLGWLALVRLTSAAELRVGPGGGYDYSSLTAALAAATGGDTIRVAAGEYSIQTGESFPLRVERAIRIEAADGATPPVVQGDGVHTVLLITSPNVVVRGLRITGGRGSEGIYGKDGGGICIFVGPDAVGQVRIEACAVEDNRCEGDETYDGCGGGIYCGGTWCTCFEVVLDRSTVRANKVPGNGGGVFCGLLSRVRIDQSEISGNEADDRGAGVYVDSFALTRLEKCRVVANACVGDPLRPGWGGKGGGLFLNGYAACAVRESEVVGNFAQYHGAGLFTLSSLETADTACTGGPPEVITNGVTDSLVAGNTAGRDGGGMYLGEGAYLRLRGARVRWNQATSDGGGIYAGGSAVRSSRLECLEGCLLEGNECGRQGGGVFLDRGSTARFASMRFLGNSSVDEGGGLLASAASQAAFTNCVLTYNSSARAGGGGVSLLAGAALALERCTVVGNFAVRGRSGLRLEPEATAAITNSILWRNAGGSIEAGGGRVALAFSLNEDAGDPEHAVLTGSPGFVGWGVAANLDVDATATTPGSGTPTEPFVSLQDALDAFSFRLGEGSPCLGAGSDAGNLGADAGVGGQPGAAIIGLRLGAGGYDIRGRNLMMVSDVTGAGSDASVVTNSVMGFVEPGLLSRFGITGEHLFGGLVVRGNGRLSQCVLFGNVATRTGGGLYVAEGSTNEVESSSVEGNHAGESGGGVFLSADVQARFRSSRVRANASNAEGGGLYATRSRTWFEDCAVVDNDSGGPGGGFRQEGGTAEMLDCDVVGNLAHAHGGGIHSSGMLSLEGCLVADNVTDQPNTQGGGMYLTAAAEVLGHECWFQWNRAVEAGGGAACYGWTRADDCYFGQNGANVAGGGVAGADGQAARLGA